MRLSLTFSLCALLLVGGAESSRCGNEKKTCPDGSALQRDPANDCEFPKCECRLPQRWRLLGGHIWCLWMGERVGTCMPFEERWSHPDCGCGCRPAARAPTPRVVPTAAPTPAPTPAPAAACEKDEKTCPDGSVVVRDEKDNCQFPKCRCNLPRGWSLLRKGLNGHISCLWMDPITCRPGEEMWSLADCGCGCRPAARAPTPRVPAVVPTAAPTPAPTPAPAACEKDEKTCPDGSAVQRDPANNCEFPKCKCNLPQGWSLIGRGLGGHISCLWMGGRAVTCRPGEERWSHADCGCGCRPAARAPTPPVPAVVPTAAPTPAPAAACEKDEKTCPDGSVVVRDEKDNCEFPKCECRLPQRWRLLGGHIWCLWMGERVGTCMPFEERWSHPDCGCGCRPRGAR